MTALACRLRIHRWVYREIQQDGEDRVYSRCKHDDCPHYSRWRLANAEPIRTPFVAPASQERGIAVGYNPNVCITDRRPR